MKSKKYIYDLFVQILLIFVVTYLFKTTPNKIQASFWAGALFVLIPISMMSREWIFFKWRNKIWWGAVLQFWLLFALPIFIIRIQNANTPFSEVTIGPFRAQALHSMSSYSYLLLMAATLWSWWKYRETSTPNSGSGTN